MADPPQPPPGQPPPGYQPPPAGYQPPPPGYQPPRKRRGRGCLIPLAVIGALVIVVIVIVVGASGGGDDDDDGDTAGSDGGDETTQLEEVTVTECGPPDPIGVVYARGEANNTSSERSVYLIDVVVEDPDGNQIGTGSTVADNVEPGQTAAWEVLTDTSQDRWVDGATCRVADVERDAAL